jgi:uncharacterized protein (TIGR00297 family)
MAEQLLIGILFAALISVFSYLGRFLTFGGSIAQFILGTILLGLGGWQWTIPMLVFFVSSSFLSKIGKKRRSAAEALFEKSSQRDAMQVFANGGVAGVVTLFWFITQNDLLFIAYLGAVAAATADTWGTEVGTLSRSAPVLVTTLKRVEPGTSGAISPLGLIAGACGSLAVFVSSLPWLHQLPIALALICTTVGGNLGSLVDSFAGATIQAQFKCGECGSTTERLLHCGHEARLVRGSLLVRNDQVNTISNIFGAFASCLLWNLLQ